jgi:GT2 family glycosyltransferase
MLIRRSSLETVGPFYEGFFMHMEEIDLCWRMWRKGIPIRSVPTAIVHHEGGGTLSRGSFRKSWWNHRNHWLLIARNLAPRPLMAAVMMRLLLDAIEFGWSVLTLRWKNAAAIIAADAWVVVTPCALRSARRDARGTYDLPIDAPVFQGSMVLAAIRGKSSEDLAMALTKSTDDAAPS